MKTNKSPISLIGLKKVRLTLELSYEIFCWAPRVDDAPYHCIFQSFPDYGTFDSFLGEEIAIYWRLCQVTIVKFVFKHQLPQSKYI